MEKLRNQIKTLRLFFGSQTHPGRPWDMRLLLIILHIFNFRLLMNSIVEWASALPLDSCHALLLTGSWQIIIILFLCCASVRIMEMCHIRPTNLHDPGCWHRRRGRSRAILKTQTQRESKTSGMLIGHSISHMWNILLSLRFALLSLTVPPAFLSAETMNIVLS